MPSLIANSALTRPATGSSQTAPFRGKITNIPKCRDAEQDADSGLGGVGQDQLITAELFPDAPFRLVSSGMTTSGNSSSPMRRWSVGVFHRRTGTAVLGSLREKLEGRM